MQDEIFRLVNKAPLVGAEWARNRSDNGGDKGFIAKARNSSEATLDRGMQRRVSFWSWWKRFFGPAKNNQLLNTTERR
jgi:hypothetical protein